ncbi:LacI family DNA-binding transcriptional regulator [Gracilinema caldarium]|uniref:LacI family DNA-binding transcriptional regulator n=1 Tax=Gracilinema caldarium TaxID=215591 RepID=UPI0026F33342|nr:LacI family DNA-binding transcriptional regulator [Gracilinema caldarium]
MIAIDYVRLYDRMTMVTIYDIAKITGYSAPTVSKALNNQSDIGQKTKEKILKVAKELGYVPNSSAKGLVTKKSWLIGLIYEEDDMGIGIEHPLFSTIINAFKQEMESEGYELIFIARNLGGKRMSLLEHCRYRQVDGVLVVNVDAKDEEVRDVTNSNIPCISSNIVFPEIATVTSENIKPAVEAVQYLYKLGHRLIAHIAGPQDSIAAAGYERLEGYKAGLLSRHLPIRDEFIIISEYWNGESGYKAMMDLWRRNEKPTAIFCASDIMAMGVMNACHDLGLRIPEDISIISFDDNLWASFSHPPLTTFRQDRQAIGRKAAELMKLLLNGEKVPSRVLIPVQLIERDSCAPPHGVRT